jgi:hypothetical protein
VVTTKMMQGGLKTALILKNYLGQQQIKSTIKGFFMELPPILRDFSIIEKQTIDRNSVV